MANELAKRIFRKEALKRVYSKARLWSAIVGAGLASVLFLTKGSILAMVVCAFIAFVLFRYGQIKGYID